MPYSLTPEEKERVATLCDYILSTSESPVETYLAKTALYLLGIAVTGWVYEVNVTSWILNDDSYTDHVKELATWVAARLDDRN